MVDAGDAKIRVTVRRRFMDHVWLQLWWRWSTLPKVVLFCVVAVLLGMGVADWRGDMSFIVIADRMAHSLWFAAEVVLSGLAVVLALQFLPHVLSWLSGQAGAVTFTFDDEGIIYSAGNAIFPIRWPGVALYAETHAALFIATKRAGFRLPKRSFEGGSLDAVRALLAAKNIRRVAVWRVI
jgi:hypothetical protein